MMDFNEVFSSFSSIEFNSAWKNQTGYLDHAVNGENAPRLLVGEVRSFVDDKSRKGFIIATPRGNVVVFQRYSGGQKGIWVSNIPKSIRDFLGPDYTAAFNEELALKLVGYYPDFGSVLHTFNIGHRINDFMTN